MESPVRVRFAPSPTGYLHIGGLRTALYNWLFARRHGGCVVLRIEDTDRSRYVPGAAENLRDTLRRAGLDFDESPPSEFPHGPYVQSERTAIYRTHADTLLASGDAYRCFCGADRLDSLRALQQERGQDPMYDRACRSIRREESDARAAAGEAHTIRLAVPAARTIALTDLVRGDVSFESAQIDDQVLLKSDEFPTYHLANVVDDHLMRISHVIRGEEWLPSTPKHLLLYEAFGWTPPVFAHLPLLLNPDRSKLSKRQGDVAVEDYLRKGYLPAALVNFVALLGWSPPDNREIFSLADLIPLFDLDRVGKSGAVFDTVKLDWFNGQHLRALPPMELAELCLPFLREAGVDISYPDRVEAVVVALQKQLTLPRDIVPLLVPLHEGLIDVPDAEDREALSTPDARRVLAAAAEAAAGVESWERTSIKAMISGVQLTTGLKGRTLFLPLRLALTGTAHGPDLPVLAELIGRDLCVSRLQAWLD
jgi:nondiscriminating glutamyl-tRNA synthetase